LRERFVSSFRGAAVLVFATASGAAD